MEAGNILNYAIALVLPGIAALLGWLFIKPAQEEMRISSLRRQIRSSIRFKISYSLASKIPERKKNIQLQDYISQCSEEINSFLGSDTDVLIDYYVSERLSKKYLFFLRFFKYVVYIIPLVGILLVTIPYIFFLEILSTLYLIICGVVLVFLIILSAIIMERKKDKFHDLCMKYEIVTENKNDN